MNTADGSSQGQIEVLHDDSREVVIVRYNDGIRGREGVMVSDRMIYEECCVPEYSGETPQFIGTTS